MKGRQHPAVWASLLALPLLGLWLLLWRPELDVNWEQHPSHFWLVLGVGALNAVMAYATGEAARVRGDARLFLISLAFLVSGGFLGLHALATPGVVLDAPNTGFVVASPIGLLLAGVLAAASGFVDANPELAPAVVRRQRLLRAAVIALLVAWAAWSLSGLPPLNRAFSVEAASPPLIVLAAAGVLLYCTAAARYVPVWRRRRCPLPASVVVAFALLAEAMIAIAFSRSWHATWWEWHLLMLLAFGAVAVTARRQWREERFSDLYLEDTLGGLRDVSVLFADLQGYTAFSEREGASAATAMLNAYFDALVPVARAEGADVELIGDALMARFNTRGDQDDHPLRAARTGLGFQREAARVVALHSEWPQLRVGINSGEARVGVLGAAGGRTYTATGDTVNLASRLEGQARPGEVVIGSETHARLGAVDVEEIGEVRVKGKERPVAAYVLRGLAVGQGENRLEEQEDEGGG